MIVFKADSEKEIPINNEKQDVFSCRKIPNAQFEMAGLYDNLIEFYEIKDVVIYHIYNISMTYEEKKAGVRDLLKCYFIYLLDKMDKDYLDYLK